jgi:hypothetical protein
MYVPQTGSATEKAVEFDIKSVASMIFLGIVIIFVAQYYDKKIAFALAGLIFLTSLLMNIEKLKGVFV